MFLTGINEYSAYISEWANKKGFWKFTYPQPGESTDLVIDRLIPNDHYLVKSTKIMLMVSELGEMLEGIRKPVASKMEGFTNEEEELADFVIRAMDYAGQYNLRLAEAIIAKMAINEGRPHKHGKTF